MNVTPQVVSDEPWDTLEIATGQSHIPNSLHEAVRRGDLGREGEL